MKKVLLFLVIFLPFIGVSQNVFTPYVGVVDVQNASSYIIGIEGSFRINDDSRIVINSTYTQIDTFEEKEKEMKIHQFGSAALYRRYFNIDENSRLFFHAGIGVAAADADKNNFDFTAVIPVSAGFNFNRFSAWLEKGFTKNRYGYVSANFGYSF